MQEEAILVVIITTASDNTKYNLLAIRDKRWVSGVRCVASGHHPAITTGNTIPEPHTEDGLPDWAIGVLVAAIAVTVVWILLLIALVSCAVPSSPVMAARVDNLSYC